MLTGYLKCDDIGKLILSYINFDLSKKNMSRVARHLRNCPKCTEKYSSIISRQKELKKRYKEIEKKLRTENEISSYIDNEAEKESVYIIEKMLECDINYKKEFDEIKKFQTIMKKAQQIIFEAAETKNSESIIFDIKKKKRKKLKLMIKFIRFFQLTRRVFAECR